MIIQKPYQRGFVGGAYIAMMVALVAVLGTVLNVSSNTAKKLTVTQNAVNTQNTADKLKQYLINNTAADVDSDGILELPEQKDPLNGQRDPNEPYFASEPGLLPESIPDHFTKDAMNNSFRICSYNLGRNIGDDSTAPYRYPDDRPYQSEEENINRLVFAILSPGSNGKFDSTYSCPTILENYYTDRDTAQGDDIIVTIKYSEVFNARMAARKEVLKDDVPQKPCDATNPYFTAERPYNPNIIYTLEFVPANTPNINDSNEAKWACVPKFNALAAQNLPVCSAAERLSVIQDENGRYVYTCSTLEQIGNNAEENFDIARMAASFCPRGYLFSGLANVSRSGSGGNSTIRNITQITINCVRMTSAGTEFGAANITKTYPFSNTCSISPPTGKTMLIYLRRDGKAACTPVANSMLLKNPPPVLPQRNCAPTDINFYNQTGIICFATNLELVNSKNICGINESISFNSDTKTVECRPAANTKKWVLPMRSDGNQCQNGDAIIYDSAVSGYICRSTQFIMDLLKPATACSSTQMVSWDTTNFKFKCIQR